jgi:hypothetical protein
MLHSLQFLALLPLHWLLQTSTLHPLVQPFTTAALVQPALALLQIL